MSEKKSLYIIGAVNLATAEEKEYFNIIENHFANDYNVINPYKIGKIFLGLNENIDDSVIMKYLLKYVVETDYYVLLPTTYKSFYGQFEINMIKLLNEYNIGNIEQIPIPDNLLINKRKLI